MKIIIVKDYQEMSEVSANLVATQLKDKADSILGLATGGTPEGMYKILVDKFEADQLDFSEVKSFNLDEYVGIESSHKLSYRTYMNEQLFDKVNIDLDNTKIPDNTGDVNANGAAYDLAIEAAGGIDLQILGIGANAHIAFNEPGSDEKAGTREVELTDSTIEANSRYFDSKEDVPKTAVSMGIGSILKSKKIVLLASGKNKAQAIKDTVESDISKDVPASFLRKHDDVTIVIDEDAASLLKK